MKKKKINTSGKGIMLMVVLVLAAMLLLIGCTKGGMYVVFMGKVDVMDQEISGSYQYFDGMFFSKLELNEKDAVSINFNHITQKGSIEVVVLNEGGDEVLSITENADKVQLPINEEGLYTIKAVASKHKGKFKVDWEVE